MDGVEVWVIISVTRGLIIQFTCVFMSMYLLFTCMFLYVRIKMMMMMMMKIVQIDSSVDVDSQTQWPCFRPTQYD